MKINLKKILSLALSASLLLALPTFGSAVSDSTDEAVKEEAVYVRLGTDGSVEHAYVVNRLENPGPDGYADYGRYSETTDLTGTGSLRQDGETIRIQTTGSPYYYQGTLQDPVLPWLIDITYTLDKNPIDANDLPGADGTLVLQIGIKDNPEVQSGQTGAYAVQTTVTLNADRCTDVETDGATRVWAGSDQVFSYMKLPGQDALYELRMQVTDFAMDGIQLAGVRFQPEAFAPDLGSLNDGLNSLNDGIRLLDEAAGQLNGGLEEASGGLSTMMDGLDELQDAADALAQGLLSLSASGSDLVSGSADIGAGLAALASALPTPGSTELVLLSGGSAGILSGIGNLKDSLHLLQDQIAQVDAAIAAQYGGAYSGLEEANQAILDTLALRIADLTAEDPVTNADDIALLTETVTLLAASTDLLTGLTDALNGVPGSDNPGLAVVADLLAQQMVLFDDEIQDLVTLVGSLSGQIAQMSGAQDTFQQGLTSYMDGPSELAAGGNELADGLVTLAASSRQLSDAVRSLTDGAASLKEGTSGLSAGTSGMKEQLATALGVWMPADPAIVFEPVSFASPDNTNVRSVQWTMTTPAIQKTVEPIVPDEPVQQTFWQRLLALFGLD